MKKFEKYAFRIAFLSLTFISTLAIIHNAYLAKETATLHTGSLFLDWTLAITFALGIESGLWALILNKKSNAVKAYMLVLFTLSMIYYGRGGKLNQIVNKWHPEAWLFIEGIGSTLIFAGLLSMFAWYLTDIIIAKFALSSEAQEQAKAKEEALQAKLNRRPHTTITDTPTMRNTPVSTSTSVPVPVKDPLPGTVSSDSYGTVMDDAKELTGVKNANVSTVSSVIEPEVSTLSVLLETEESATIGPINQVHAEKEPSFTVVHNANVLPLPAPNGKMKTCLNCGTSFEALRSTKVYCSDRCKKEYNNGKNAGLSIPKNAVFQANER